MQSNQLTSETIASDPNSMNGAAAFAYDPMNRLTLITYPDSTTTQFAYDYRGRRTSVTDQNDAVGDVKTIQSSNAGGANLAYVYDALNRLSTVTDPNGTTGYNYDNVGNLAGFTYPNNVTHSYNYANRNRLTSLAASGQPARWRATATSSMPAAIG